MSLFGWCLVSIKFDSCLVRTIYSLPYDYMTCLVKVKHGSMASFQCSFSLTNFQYSHHYIYICNHSIYIYIYIYICNIKNKHVKTNLQHWLGHPTALLLRTYSLFFSILVLTSVFNFHKFNPVLFLVSLFFLWFIDLIRLVWILFRMWY